jgi:hypothetical protein
MVTKTHDMTAALWMQSESPIMLPTLLASSTAPVSVTSWHQGVDVPSNAPYGTHADNKATVKTTSVFAPAMDAINLDPRSRQAKHAAPPRGFR